MTGPGFKQPIFTFVEKKIKSNTLFEIVET